MKHGMINNVSGVKRLLNQLAAQKKKTVVAACLIGVMFFMWGRVLLRDGSKGTAAGFAAQQILSDQSGSEVKVDFKKLPKVPGRNDVLIRDFFDGENWLNFVRYGEGGSSSGSSQVNMVSQDGSMEAIAKTAEALRLDAIELGVNPQAFINDKLLSVGDKLVVGDRANRHEFEVVGIRENTVFLRCGEAEITLKLMDTVGEGS